MGSFTIKRTIWNRIVRIISTIIKLHTTLKLQIHYFFRFLILNAVSLYAYFTNFQQIDEEEFGGAWELTKEGFVTSLAGFLVRKIVAYKLFLYSSFQ